MIVQSDTSTDVGRGAKRQVGGGARAGPVTFLFTDIEGSTRVLREVGAGVFGRVLLEHDRVVREAVDAGGGHVVDTQGDAFFAAFADARAAVAAAVAVQRATAARAWPGGVDVRLRMGVHTGQPEVSGDRYFGLDVHLGARVAAAAHGGQVVITEATRAYLDGDESGVRVRDLGAHVLKDFEEPRRLFQVAAAGMQDECPPLRTGGGGGAFAGREDELAEAAVESVVRAARRRERRRLLLIAAAVAVPVAVIVGVVLTRPGQVQVAPNSVAVLDAASGRLEADVALGPTPSRIVAGRGDVWVLNQDGQTLSRIDATTRHVTTVGLVQQPTDLAVNGRTVWVVSGVARTISVVDARTLSPVQTLPLKAPAGILDTGQAGVSASGGQVWVSTGAGLSRFSGSGHREPVVPGVPHGVVAATPTGVWVGGGYGLFGSSGTVERIDPQSGKPVTQIPTQADAVAVGAGWVWTADTTAGMVSRINPATNAITHTTPVPGVDAIAAAAGAVWAASADGDVLRINPSTGRVVTRVRVGGSPAGLAIANGRVWVAVQAATPARRSGGLRVALPAPIDSPDPAFAFQALSWQILYATGLNLVAYPDSPAPAGLRLAPGAAVSMPRVSDHGHTYTLVVRPGYRFSPPSDRPVTAADFRTAIERAIKIGKNSEVTFLTGDIAGAQAYASGRTRHVSGVRVHGRRISITTTDVNPAFPAELALPLFSAVPPDAPVRTTGDTPLAGAGPYYIKTYVPHRELVLARNPHYPGPRTAHLKTITYHINPTSSWHQVASGSTDYDPGDAPPPARILTRLGPGSGAAESGHQQVFVNPAIAPAVYFFALNTNRPLFQHVLVRQAINYAINRVALSGTLGRPTSDPTDQYLPSNMPGYPGNGHVYPLAQPDLGRARQLMRRARVALPAHAILNTCTTSPCHERATLLTHELAAIGIHVTVHALPRSTEFNRDITGRGFDIADEGFQFPVNDPAFFFTAGFGYLNIGPYRHALQQAAHTFPPHRAPAFRAFDLTLARQYAPLAAYAIPDTADYFSRSVGCQIYQPVFGIDLTRLCIRG